METKRDILNHFRYLKKAIDETKGEAYMNMASFHAELKIGNTIHRLHPKFVSIKDGRMSYDPFLTVDAVRFGGWSNNPPNKPFWFGEKLAFKELMKKNNFTIPDFSTEETGGGLTDVIVKSDVSGFSANIKGPFHKPPASTLDAKSGMFFEKYITGRIVKIWFWNSTPICAEIKDFPSVTGDGKTTIKALIEQIPTRLGDAPRLDKVTEVLAYYGHKLDTVLKAGTTQIIDFRYTSQFSRPETVEEINYSDKNSGRGMEELVRLGDVLYTALQSEGYNDYIFTVDAIEDSKKKLWYLEANPFPFIHPFVYQAMIAALAMKSAHSEGAQTSVINHVTATLNTPYSKLN